MTTTTAAATIVKAVFNGVSGPGPVSIPGLNAGDVLLRCVPSGFTNGFEPVVSADGQLQQIDIIDWSSIQIVGYFLRDV
ncbi:MULTISPECIES: hypothetical protein [Burkholderia]|uniref:hypothetical protein n=1 Tax=Burkholderia TaxID=32008 RepID=UPI0011B058C5|nr:MULTISPECIES: hypothetical protein [Burkholderia]MDF3091470.1 hypothetical protein [Burkholderia semiarida]MDF3116301.1 hypothetical protein [Burkholderia semiarida]